MCVVGKYVLLAKRPPEFDAVVALDNTLIMLHTLHVAPINA